MEGILGKKLGMTQIFEEDGKVVPVTIVQAGPCLVVQRKTAESDGYDAVQVGLVEERAPRKVPQPLKGHFDKAGVTPTYRLAEFRVDPGEEVAPGDQVKASLFQVDDYGASRGWSSATASAAAAPPTAPCSTGLPAPSASRPSPPASSRASACRGRRGPSG